jgi:hypothetical protein
MYTFNWDNLAVTRLQFNISFLGCKRSVLLFNAMQRVIYHNHLVLCLNCAARASTNESSENISSCFISRCISSSIDWLFDAHQFVYRTPNLARYGFFCEYSMTRLLECVYRFAEQLQGLLSSQTVVAIAYQSSQQLSCLLFANVLRGKFLDSIIFVLLRGELLLRLAIN